MQSEQEMTTDEIHRLSSTAFSGFENELFLNTSTSVYTFDTTQYIPEKIFDWEQAGFSGGDICHMVSLKNGELLCAMRNNNVLNRIEIIEDTSQRKKITIGAINREGNDLEPYVARFNASQDAYFAEIIYYGPENTSRLKTELIAGTAPDVLLLNETTITVSEASFTDLLPLLNEDETLAGDDLVENIFQLMLMEGKMLFAMDSFWFVTITGRSQTVGDRNTWTTKDFEQLLAAHPESYTFNWWQNRQFLGAHAAMMSIGDCVDFDTMTCDFEKDSFTDLLSFIEIAGALCAPEGAMQDDDERILLQFHGAQNELHANGCALTYGPGNYSYIGFPNDEGTPGGYFEPSPFGLVFAIPQQTANKDAAWQFIRGIYDREWQDREIMPGAPFGSGFAVTKASRDARIEHIQEMEDAHCTEEDVSKMLEAMEQTTSFYYPEDILYDIIYEEITAFLSGQKSAEETAHVVQSRVSLYLEERR